jgi:hypothetical protein
VGESSVRLCTSLVEEEDFGSEGGDLADRDRDLILFVSSAAQLLSAEDHR